MVTASAFDHEIRMAILGASNIVGDAERQAALTVFFLGTSWIFLFTLAILTVFYSLDSLYAERRDKSILFWRSLPITDVETVLSKLLTVIIVIPLVTIAAIIVTHLVNLAVSSVWIAIKGGDAGHLVWGSVALLDNWTAATIVTFLLRALDVTVHWLVPVRVCLHQANAVTHGIHAVDSRSSN